MTHIETLEFWITIGRIVIGLSMLAIILSGMYKFKQVLLTGLGVLVLSNVASLLLIAGWTCR